VNGRIFISKNFPVTFVQIKASVMSLPTNNKKGENQQNKNKKDQGKGSKFIKSSAKPAGAIKKVRSTGANRGS
jgi:hypothetical protein